VQDVKIRCDKHGDRSLPKADIITEQLDLCSSGPTSGAAGYRLEPSPRVLWMNFNGHGKTSPNWCCPMPYSLGISKEEIIPIDYPKTVVLN